MNKIGSKRIEGLVQSDIRAMTRECLRLNGINLGQGICELPTPEPIVKSAQAALVSHDKAIYSAAEGIAPLRAAIAQKLERENGIRVHADKQIIVTVGATGGYASTLMALFNPGDGILLFEPFYGYHLNAAVLAELEPQFVPFSGMTVDETAIRKAIQPNTRAIVVCTPANPSGKMWNESELELVARVAHDHDLIVITDEMYEYFRYDGREHVSPGSLASLADCTVTLMGLSKTFSMTGWRLGYVCAPEAMAEKIRLANDLFYVCAPTPLQHGALAGFTVLNPSYFTELREEFQAKRDQICETLETVGMNPIAPQGAYYVLADTSRFGVADSRDFAMKLLEKVRVAGVPGRAFFHSSAGDRYIRFCFGVTDERLNKACKQLRELRGGF